MKGNNMHTSREAWLLSGKKELQLLFEMFGYKLPDNIRFAIAFTSAGKRGRTPVECWHPASSADGHFEIIIRADMADPVIVLAHLVHALIHTLLPANEKHGKQFKEIAKRIGLEGKMREATPGPVLRERLNMIAAMLGPLPHAKLDFSAASDVPAKQSARMLKAECPVCGYTIRLAAKWARRSLPVCPEDAKHGTFLCNLPEGDEIETPPPVTIEATQISEGSFA